MKTNAGNTSNDLEENPIVEFDSCSFSSMGEWRRVNCILSKMDSKKAAKIAKRHNWKIARKNEDES